ncbi:phosphoribosylaminoimidazolecarboxamide formyltransferase [Streptomyces varsoviensis]|uniref:phosphoribosylaminoimidazolecarboxamide formyltransferase n=1 Tax=Streptomyces varsoviensis TaxID=67373 RepID=UPI0033CD17F2
MPSSQTGLPLKYGLNPQQARAMVTMPDGGPLPFSVLNGTPSVVNLLDALQGWQLVRAASDALGAPAAASMKHVSPAGAALAGDVDATARAAFALDGPLSAVASAYARARDCDPRSSYGDLAALSHPVDADTARLLARVVSDGVIAPAYEPGVLATLSRKKRGAFLVLEMDPGHVPPPEEVRDVFGVRLVQDRDPVTIDGAALGAADGFTEELRADAVLGLIAARYAQSNSVAYVSGGRTVGIGTGQQSRVDCVRLAGEKADRWRLRRHPRLTGAAFPDGTPLQERVNTVLRRVEEFDAGERAAWLAREAPCTLASDAYFPFRDNVDVAAAHGVRCVVEGGGSRRSDEVEAACREHGIVLVRTGLRLFSH